MGVGVCVHACVCACMLVYCECSSVVSVFWMTCRLSLPMELITRTVNVYCVSGSRSNMISSSTDSSTCKTNTAHQQLLVGRECWYGRQKKRLQYLSELEHGYRRVYKLTTGVLLENVNLLYMG